MSKMKWHGLWVVGLSAVCSTAFCQIDGALNPQRDFVTTDKSAFLMLAPDVICGPIIKRANWSNDGERLLILRDYMDLSPEMAAELLLPASARQDAEPQSEQQVLSWSSVTRKTKLLFKLNAKDGLIREADWMTGSSSAIVVATYFLGEDPSTFRTNLFLVNASGAVKNVTPIDFKEQYTIEISPYASKAALIEYPPYVPAPKGDPPAAPQPATVRFFSFDGSLTQTFKMPAQQSMLMWNPDGRTYCLTFARDPKTKVAKKMWAVANSATGKFESCGEPAHSGLGSADPKQEIGVVDLPVTTSFKKMGINAPTVLAMASEESKDSQPGVVTTDGNRGELSPKLNAVSYVSQGSLMVRPMVKVPLDAYKRALAVAMRTELLTKAKQIGLGLLMYSADYDDNLPSNQGNWSSVLSPYLRNSNLTDGFNYVYGGGNTGDMQSPATTPLGYFEGTGGRAYVYGDGHAQWVPNP